MCQNLWAFFSLKSKYKREKEVDVTRENYSFVRSGCNRWKLLFHFYFFLEFSYKREKEVDVMGPFQIENRPLSNNGKWQNDNILKNFQIAHVWPLFTFLDIYFSLIKHTLPLIMQLIFKINYLFQFKTVAPFISNIFLNLFLSHKTDTP